MSDIAGIAGNAVAVYQQALTTVSNNIANVSTEGYSRQDVSLSALPVTKAGNVFLGSGVAMDRVKRQYDEFVESNLRSTTSDLAAQGPMVTYANRVVDVLGSATMGLNTALDSFFASARTLSGDPSSTVLRSSFLRDTQGVTDRMGQLSAQLDLVQEQTQHELDNSVSQINALTSQIALVNGQLTKQRTEAAQPPDLLDQRDLLLKKLSEFTHINTRFTPNGQVTVSLGTTVTQDVVVDGQKAVYIAANYNAAGPEKAALVLDPYGKPTSLGAITSGSIAGLLSFRDQVLGGSRNALDGLARVFANEVNTIHQQGIDAYGNPGKALVQFDPTAATAAGGISVALSDPLQVAAAAQFRVIEGDTNPSGTNASVTYDDPPPPPITNGGAPPPPPKGPGPASLQTTLVNNESPSAAKAFNITTSVPLAGVAAINLGMQDVSIYLDNMSPGQQLQVMTRDGRQLMGTDLASDPTLVGRLITADNGFAVGATYSNAYLNKAGADGYKDMTVFYGAQATVQKAPVYNSKDEIASYTYQSAVLTGNRIEPLGAYAAPMPAGSFTLNGVDMPAIDIPTDGSTLQADAIATWANSQSATTGVRASATNVIRVEESQMKFGMPLFINGIQVVTTTATDAKSMATAINNTTGLSDQVLAKIDANGQLLITNARGKEGQDITIAATSVPGSSTLNALGLTPNIYRGQLSLSQPSAILLDQAVNELDFSKDLYINGEQVVPQAYVVGDGAHEKAVKLAQAINATTDKTQVFAWVNHDDHLILSNAAGMTGADAVISSAPLQYEEFTGKPLLSASTATLFKPNPDMVYRASTANPFDAKVQVGFGTGTPAMLSSLGLRTGAFIAGASKDDLLVFVTGAGAARISASYSGQPQDAKQALRAQPLEVKIGATDPASGKIWYTITDTKTNTEVARRQLDPLQLNPAITYQGINLSFTAPPKQTDVFTIDGNRDGIGNNDNMLAMSGLETKAVVGGKTLSNSYIDQVNEMGNIARQASISQTALTVVHDQAVSSRDQLSGVSLDKEAADLIRYQQAYQASAKALQMAGQLFDAVLHVQ